MTKAHSSTPRPTPGLTNLPLWRVGRAGLVWERDHLVTEEPLEVQVAFSSGDTRVVESIAVTMRTPGDDFHLARGFLFAEGMISSADQVERIEHLRDVGTEEICNRVRVILKPGVSFDAKSMSRHVFTSSSCGVCGKITIDAVRTKVKRPPQRNGLLDPKLLYRLNDSVSQRQFLFRATGGVHGAALFNVEGELLDLYEDVGRHNAVDKLIGAALLRQDLDPGNCLLWLSGRAGFELVQKAAMAGFPFVVAVGAPSSLSRQLAEDMGITLVGFLKNHQFNVYSHVDGVVS